MKTIRILIYFIFQAEIMLGCAQVAITDLKSPELVVSKKIDFSKQKVALVIDVSVDEMDQMDTVKSNRIVYELYELLSQELQLKYKADVVKKVDDTYNINYVLSIRIRENNQYLETGSGKFLRGISFGFIPQDVQKNSDFTLKIYNAKKTILSQVENTYNSNYKYIAPMLVIPLNLDQNPQTYDLQIKQYHERVLNLLRQIIQL